MAGQTQAHWRPQREVGQAPRGLRPERGQWTMKSGLWQREQRTTCFSGGLGPGKVGGGQSAGRRRVGAGIPTRLWKRGRWEPATLPSRTSADSGATRGGGGGKGVRRGDGGVAPPHRNLAFAGAERSAVGSNPGRSASSGAHGPRRPAGERPWTRCSSLWVSGRDSAACAGLEGPGAQRWAGGEPGPRGRGDARPPVTCRRPARGVRAQWRPGLEARGPAQGTRAQAWG